MSPCHSSPPVQNFNLVNSFCHYLYSLYYLPLLLLLSFSCNSFCLFTFWALFVHFSLFPSYIQFQLLGSSLVTSAHGTFGWQQYLKPQFFDHSSTTKYKHYVKRSTVVEFSSGKKPKNTERQSGSKKAAQPNHTDS